MNHPDMTAVYRAFAVVLPALLGQGLIYLCITGELGIAAAVMAIAGIGTLALSTAALARAREEQRLVARNAPPAYLLHRMQRATAH